MSELIAIREAARRLGVSETAVHKAIRSGRVSLAESHPKKLLAWPNVQQQWGANSDPAKRHRVGPQGSSPRRASYGGNVPPAAPLPTAAEAMSAAPPPAGATSAAPSLAASRAVREAYQARLAKLEYEKAIGKLIDADEVKVSAFKLARQVRDAVMAVPDRIASEIAAEADAGRVHALISRELRVALQSLGA